MDRNCDFSGWATKSDLLCSDGKIIDKGAFACDDGAVVPLAWNHNHDDPFNVLGHALLENRDEGVYAYCSFNDTEAGRTAKDLVMHGDIKALSIYANKLKKNGNHIEHGRIREVSLVYAPANPGAYIKSVVCHSDDDEDEGAEIYTGESLFITEDDVEHAECNTKNEKEKKDMETKNNNNNNEDGKTVEDVINSMTEEQKNIMYAIVGQALEDAGIDVNEEGDDEDMKHNIFSDGEETYNGNVISHSEIESAIKGAKREGSMRESFIAHGIEEIEYLFPDAKTTTNVPEFIKRDTGWVSNVMSGVHHTPFSRIKSIFADITADDARAKGYIKGKLKKEEVFTLLKRTTQPTTVYKKQKMDRDDVTDITDFDVIAWIKSEMRMMLDEEIARAILIGDGRLSSSDDKIDESCIRPIAKDDDLYTIKALIEVEASATATDKARAFIRGAIKARKDYKGSGSPVLYTTEDILTDCLLIEDSLGHLIYDSVAKLANVLRVKEIITVPVMENVKGKNDGDLLGVIVNLQDYNVGADKGGAVNMFDDFDIDYNQQKYLIETRCSGALTKPYSAISLELKVKTA